MFNINKLLKIINDPNYKSTFIKVINNDQYQYFNLEYLKEISTVLRDMLSEISINDTFSINIDDHELFKYFCKTLEYNLSTDDEIYLTHNRQLLYLLCAELDFYGMTTFLKNLLRIITVPVGMSSSTYIFSGPPSKWIFMYKDLFSNGVKSFIINKFISDDGCILFIICKSLSNKQYRYLLSFLKKNTNNELVKRYESCRKYVKNHLKS